MKDKLREIISKSNKDETRKILEDLLAELVEEKWEPKKYIPNWYILSDGKIISSSDEGDEYRLYGNEFPTEETTIIARNMNKRNQLILQAKIEMGYGDGRFGIFKQEDVWMCGTHSPGNPELTFETREQAETVLNMVKPYLEE